MTKKITALRKKSLAPAGTITIGDKTIKLTRGTLASVLARMGRISGDRMEEFIHALWYGQIAKDDQKRIDKNDDSGHYFYPPEEREQLVKRYREARAAGKVFRKASWVEDNIGVSVRTFQNWEEEFPEE